MANYQNGLYLTNGRATDGGHLLARWLHEFMVYILGWTAVQNDDANYTAVSGSGSSGATTTNPDEFDLSSDAYTVTTADQDRYITITGFTAGNAVYNGIYRILRVDTTAEILYLDIKRGVHENGLPASLTGISFRIWDPSLHPANSKYAVVRTAYTHTPTEPNFDFRILTNTVTHYAPKGALGPFGTWSTGAWSDSRNTADRDFETTATHYGSYIWAWGDDTHCVVGWRCDEYNSTELQFLHLGEITPAAGTGTDTNPAVMWLGSSTVEAIGPGSGAQLPDTCYMMAYAGGSNNVEVAAYLLAPTNVVGAAGTDHLFMQSRSRSEWSRNLYRTDIMVQSRTASHREMRGTLQNTWFTSPKYPFVTPFGSSKEYLHLAAGIVIPWNGSKTHVQWDNTLS